MLGTVGKAAPQAYVTYGNGNRLHGPVRLVKLRGLRPVSPLKPKQFASVRVKSLTCRVSAISSFSQSQTQSLSNGPSMATEGVEVAIPELQQLCQDALSTLGYTDQQGATITEVDLLHCTKILLHCTTVEGSVQLTT